MILSDFSDWQTWNIESIEAKVIIEKSRGEVSLVELDTIENVS